MSKWTLEELNAKVAAHGEEHRKLENENRDKLSALYQEGYQAILKEAGWTNWDYMCETEPSFMGAGPFIREGLRKMSPAKQVACALQILASYEPNLPLHVEGTNLLIFDQDFSEKVTAHHWEQLEILGFTWVESYAKFWKKENVFMEQL